MIDYLYDLTDSTIDSRYKEIEETELKDVKGKIIKVEDKKTEIRKRLKEIISKSEEIAGAVKAFQSLRKDGSLPEVIHVSEAHTKRKKEQQEREEAEDALEEGEEEVAEGGDTSEDDDGSDEHDENDEDNGDNGGEKHVDDNVWDQPEIRKLRAETPASFSELFDELFETTGGLGDTLEGRRRRERRRGVRRP